MRFAIAFERKSTGGMTSKLTSVASNRPTAAVKVMITPLSGASRYRRPKSPRFTAVTRVGESIRFACVRVLTPASRVLTEMCTGSLCEGPCGTLRCKRVLRY